jgi:hypothetical protein
MSEHSEMSFNQYLAIIFRISVIFFDMNYKGTAPVRNYKKLLNLLSRIELTTGYSAFIGELRHSKGLKMQTSLTPPKPLLMQLYLNEQVFATHSELEYVRDVFLQQQCDSYQICKLIMDSAEKPIEMKKSEL